MTEQDDAPRRAEPIDRLRDDVRVLGHAVGEVLREQGGAALLGAVEHVRTEAIAVRSPGEIDSRREDDLLRYVEAQSADDLLLLVRAFSVYFHVINVAEQHHRVRNLSARTRSGGLLHESI